MKHPMSTLLALAAALCAAFAPPAAAQDEPEYLVELVIFRHTSPFDAGEVWTPSIPLYGLPLEPEDPDAPPPRRVGRFERLGPEDFKLGETVDKLAKASRFNVLSHSGWRQAALANEEAEFKSVAGRDGVARVTGTVLLTRSRYLRLDFDLKIAADGNIYHLQQDRRRVQTGVPHYIDHPHVGVVALISRAPDSEPEPDPPPEESAPEETAPQDTVSENNIGD